MDQTQVLASSSSYKPDGSINGFKEINLQYIQWNMYTSFSTDREVI